MIRDWIPQSTTTHILTLCIELIDTFLPSFLTLLYNFIQFWNIISVSLFSLRRRLVIHRGYSYTKTILDTFVGHITCIYAINSLLWIFILQYLTSVTFSVEFGSQLIVGNSLYPKLISGRSMFTALI